MTTPAYLTRRRSGTLDGLVNDKPIALRLPKDELAAAHACADAEGRSASNFARLIHLMGMQMYREHGRLSMPVTATTTATGIN